MESCSNSTWTLKQTVLSLRSKGERGIHVSTSQCFSLEEACVPFFSKCFISALKFLAEIKGKEPVLEIGVFLQSKDENNKQGGRQTSVGFELFAGSSSLLYIKSADSIAFVVLFCLMSHGRFHRTVWDCGKIEWTIIRTAETTYSRHECLWSKSSFLIDVIS